jgi:flagellar protein FlbD
LIYVTRLNGKQFVINSDLIETMEATPDTVVMLTTGNRYILTESLETLIERIAKFRRRCHPEIKSREEELIL